MKKIKLGVTGGRGFIGSRLIKRLSKNKNIELKVYPGDILNKKELNEFCRNVEVMVHLAVYMKNKKKRYYLVNVEGTKNVARAMGNKRLIYFSTTAIFGDRGNDWYADSKYKATKWLQRNKKNLVVIYPTAVIEAKSRGGKIMSRIGNGNRHINIVEVNNLVESLEKIIMRENIKGDLVLGGINIKVRDYLRAIGSGYLWIRIPVILVKILTFFWIGENNLKNILRKDFKDTLYFSKRAVKLLDYKPEKGLEKFVKMIR
jgi:nucleoside-diphosphate-sugar epimerase